MKRDRTKRSSLCQIDRQNLRRHSNGIRVQHAPPVKVSRANYHWLLVSSMPKNGEMQRLLQLQKKGCIKFRRLKVPLDLEGKCLSEGHVAVCGDLLGVVPVLEKADSYGNLFIITA